MDVTQDLPRIFSIVSCLCELSVCICFNLRVSLTGHYMNARWKIALYSTISSVVVIALLVAAAMFVHMRVGCARLNALDDTNDSANEDETCAKGCDGCVGWCNEKYTADEEMDANLDCHELCSKSYPQCWTGCLEREVDGMNATQAAIEGKTQKNART